MRHPRIALLLTTTLFAHNAARLASAAVITIDQPAGAVYDSMIDGFPGVYAFDGTPDSAGNALSVALKSGVTEMRAIVEFPLAPLAGLTSADVDSATLTFNIDDVIGSFGPGAGFSGTAAQTIFLWAWNGDGAIVLTDFNNVAGAPAGSVTTGPAGSITDDLHRHLRFGRQVTRIARLDSADAWRVETSQGVYVARYLAVATALNRTPVVPEFPGRARYHGRVVHSAHYRNARPFAGQRVLIIGSGNSAAEIALDLTDHGAGEVCLWVRGARHFVPLRVMARLFRVFRWLGMMSDTRFAAVHRIPYGSEAFWKVVRQRDAVTGRFSADLGRFGIRKPRVGPQEDAMRNGRIAVFDVGTISAIRAGRIHVIDGVARPLEGFTATGVQLSGRDERFDSVIFATGYEPNLEAFLSHPEMLGRVRWWRSAPLTDGRSRSRVYPTAFFPGFDITANGGHSLARGDGSVVN